MKNEDEARSSDGQIDGNEFGFKSRGMVVVPFPFVPSMSDLARMLTGGDAATFGRLCRSHTLSIFAYRGEDSLIWQLVLRFDHPTEGKEFRQLVCLGKGKNGLMLYALRALDAPRPLYGLEQLIAKPDATVLIVEGEKTADAARDKLPQTAVISWMGGAKSAGKANFLPLAGRKVVLWPDNDEAGRAAMRVVAAEAYAAGASLVSLVDVPSEFRDKWDLADPIPEGQDQLALDELLENARPLRPEEVALFTVNPKIKAEQGRLLGHEPGFTRIKTEHVEYALSFIDAGLNGNDWRRLARCIYYAFGDRGLALFNRWSKTSKEKYREGEPEKLWGEYKARKNFRADSLAWLFRRAKDELRIKVELCQGVEPKPLDLESLKIAAIEELNESHAVVVRGGKTGVLWESYDPRFNRYSQVYLSKRDFIDRHVSSIALPLDDEDQNARKNKIVRQGALWFSSAWRRSYDGVLFAPGKKLGPKFLNLWRGFTVEPTADPGGWDKFKHHLFEHVACCDQASYDYLLNWLAFAVQRLGEPMGTALVLLGPKGAGKSIVTQLFGHLFGEHTFVTSRMEDVTGQFNDRLETTLLLGLEEAVAPQNRAADSTLKDLITNPRLRLEAKFFGIWHAPNHLRIIVTSNNEQVVRADASERRYAVFEVANPHQADPVARRKYFGEMVQQMETGGYEAMLGELLNRDISDWNPEVIPETPALKRQKELNQLNDPVCSFLFERLTDGIRIVGGNDASRSAIYEWDPSDSVVIPAYALIEEFKQYCEGRRVPFSGARFARELPRYMPAGFKSFVQREKLPDGSRQVKAYRLPPLEEARCSFERATGIVIEREEPDTAAT